MQVEPPAASRAPLFVLAAVTLLLIAVGLAFITGVAALPTPPPVPTSAAVDAETAGPVYRLAVIDGGRIYTIGADGRGEQSFTPRGDVPIAALIWSRDGTHLIYGQVLGDRGQLINVRADGSDPITLFDGERVAVPFYLLGAPDDRHVAFLTTDPTSGLNLQVAELDRAASASSAARGQPNYAAWSPDGQALLVHVGGAGAHAFVGTYRLGDAVTRTLEAAPALFQAPAWPPGDGDHWLYARQRGDTNILVTRQTDDEQPLAEFDGGIAFGASPDGAHVAYAINSPGSFLYERLTIVDRWGVTSTVVHRGDLMGFFWSPDSRRLAYLTAALVQPGVVGQSGERWAAPRARQPGTRLQLTWHVFDLAANRQTTLTSFSPSSAFSYVLQYFDQFAQSIAVWSPDSRWLVYTGTPFAGKAGVYVVDTQTDDAPPVFVGPGQFAAFAWR